MEKDSLVDDQCMYNGVFFMGGRGKGKGLFQKMRTALSNPGPSLPRFEEKEIEIFEKYVIEADVQMGIKDFQNLQKIKNKCKRNNNKNDNDRDNDEGKEKEIKNNVKENKNLNVNKNKNNNIKDNEKDIKVKPYPQFKGPEQGEKETKKEYQDRFRKHWENYLLKKKTI